MARPLGLPELKQAGALGYRLWRPFLLNSLLRFTLVAQVSNQGSTFNCRLQQ